jgi:hypothetical protein
MKRKLIKKCQAGVRFDLTDKGMQTPNHTTFRIDEHPNDTDTHREQMARSRYGKPLTFKSKKSKEELEIEKEKERKNEKIKREIDLVQGALNQAANSRFMSAKGYQDAVDRQVEDAKERWHTYKKGIDATMTAAELGSASYVLLRGAGHLFPSLATSTIKPISYIFSNIDTPQLVMSSVGGVADAYQLVTADNNFDRWENGIELTGDTAGIIGATNVVRNTPFFGRHGKLIDTALDTYGYMAAGWDLFKNIPFMDRWLDIQRNKSRAKHE